MTIDRSYTISADRWGEHVGADYPTRSAARSIPRPRTPTKWALRVFFFGNRLRADVTYYRTLSYDFVKDGTVSNASGFTHKKINTKEELLRRGAEVMLSATPVKERTGGGTRASTGRSTATITQSSIRILERFAVGVRRSALGLGRHSGLGARSRRQYRPRQQRTSGVEPVQVKRGVIPPDWIWGWTNTVKWKELYAFVLVRRTCGRHRFLDDRPGVVETEVRIPNRPTSSVTTRL